MLPEAIVMVILATDAVAGVADPSARRIAIRRSTSSHVGLDRETRSKDAAIHLPFRFRIAMPYTVMQNRPEIFDVRRLDRVAVTNKGTEIMSVTKFNQVIRTVVVAVTLCNAAIAFAQNSPTSAPVKTIGATTAAKSEVAPSLIVLNSRGAILQGDLLTLNGVTPNSIVFADRPVRAAGHALTADIIAEWGTGTPGEAATAANVSFAKDPPNATVSVFNKDGSVKDAVVVLKTPKLEGEKLTFNVQTLEGDINGADGPAAVFIDIIGRPFTPMSFAGVARRTAFRGAMYAGAAGAAAYGAAAYAYPYARPACGYYPYPPCY
jgi:hypothetical protein